MGSCVTTSKHSQLNKKNVYWGNLLVRGQPVFPHYKIYRRALLDIYGERFDALQRAPEIRVGVSQSAALARRTQRRGRGPARLQHRETHPQDAASDARSPDRLSPEFIRVQDCATVDDLADLILQSSCTPAVHARAAPRRPPGARRRHWSTTCRSRVSMRRPVSCWCMVTRRYPRPQMFLLNHDVQHRLYVQPSSKVPISSWDYTSPAQMQHAYDLGRRDGEAFVKRVRTSCRRLFRAETRSVQVRARRCLLSASGLDRAQGLAVEVVDDVLECAAEVELVALVLDIADVRRADGIFHAQQAVALEDRFALEYVDRDHPRPTFAECADDGVLVEQFSAARVDEQGGGVSSAANPAGR